MSSTVHQPGNIQDETPTEHCGHKPGIHKTFTPEIHGDRCWNNETSQGHQNHVVSKKDQKKSILVY